MSSENTVRSFSPSGTSPRTILCASPSTMAVLPTPGSPMSTGLFLVLRERILITSRISVSRPITGSSLPALASSVRSLPYFSSALPSSSGGLYCIFIILHLQPRHCTNRARDGQSPRRPADAPNCPATRQFGAWRNRTIPRRRLSPVMSIMRSHFGSRRFAGQENVRLARIERVLPSLFFRTFCFTSQPPTPDSQLRFLRVSASGICGCRILCDTSEDCIPRWVDKGGT